MVRINDLLTVWRKPWGTRSKAAATTLSGATATVPASVASVPMRCPVTARRAPCLSAHPETCFGERSDACFLRS